MKQNSYCHPWEKRGRVGASTALFIIKTASISPAGWCRCTRATPVCSRGPWAHHCALTCCEEMRNQSLVHLAEAYMDLEVIAAIYLKSLLVLFLLLLSHPRQGNTAATLQSCKYCFQSFCFCRVKNNPLPVPLANCLFASIKVNI